MCKILKEKGKECLKSKFKLKKKKKQDSYTDIHSHIDKRVYRPSETLHSLVKEYCIKSENEYWKNSNSNLENKNKN